MGTELNGQCNVEQLLDNAGGAPNFGGGQSFTACSAGLLEEIEFKTGGTWANPYTLELKDNSCNIIWAVTGLTAGTNQIINVNLSTGSGTSRNLTNGQKYAFGIPGSGHNLRFQTTNPYAGGGRIGQFDNNCNEDANDDLWFRVGIGQSLPVELIEFNGTLLKHGIVLFCKTASEINNSGFEIQKSLNARDWEKIDFIEGKGTANEINEYRFQDSNPISGLNYFRLKQINYDGTFEYSKVITINFSKKRELQFYPNPINEKFQIVGVEKGEIVIMDYIGRTILQTTFNGSELDISDLPIGVYFVKLSSENKIWTKRLIKQ